ncbi:MAG: error-prone DNA polymerase [Bryobacterales bacterium]|jgi:error-prone DNA polymerase|nr:error-prone DNA polymerase [Bryobacterales bacterium]
MYLELHTASAFSFLEGASLPEDLVARAAHLGYEALALCDRDGVYGAPRFYQAARQAGLRALVGCDVSLADGGRLTVLVENRKGYQNLCRLLTRMHLRAAKGEGRGTWEDLAAYAPGLVALVHNPAHALLARDRFGAGNVYVEIQRHLRREQELANRHRMDCARSLGLPLLATNGVRYATEQQKPLFDALTCLRHKTTLDRAGRLLDANGERHLKPPAVMRQLFADLPEAIHNTRLLAERLQFTLQDLGYRFPDFPLPPGESKDSYLRTVTERGARERYRPFHEKARKQIEHELRVIEKLGLAGYFLVVWDIAEFCRRQGILAQGRGSAANSAVCYSLGITAVDPVGMELLFERFLSEERGEWPDIDIDLPSGDQRERAIQYVYERYGKHGAAMTANVITYRGRSSVREMGKVLGFPEEIIGRLSACMSPFEYKSDFDKLHHQAKQAGLPVEHNRVEHLMRLALEIQNLPRHLGQHSGGLVISHGALDSVVPLENARMPGRVVVQWDKEDCADLGIIKVDLLGLGMMAALEDSVRLLRGRGVEIDLAQLPPNDPKTYTMIQQADTMGVFQIESRAQMATLPRLKPANFYDLVVEVAIIRPGPIVGKMVHPYLNRRLGREAITYPHPKVEPVLRRTLGVPLFQEQLLRIAMDAADFTGGEAEELRRAMGFKRSAERMAAIETKLRQGLQANGITGEAEEGIVRAITSFALYGFPESHAASFALLVYASAYLKAHYAAAFLAALLNCQPMGFYAPATLVKEFQRRGVRVLPVCVKSSAVKCTLPDDNTVRLGLRYVAGLREDAAQGIQQERFSNGQFRGLQDFTRRTRLRKDELDTLAEMGALNGLDETLHRREALWQVAKFGRPAGPLLEQYDEAHSDASPLGAMSAMERMEADYRNSGLTVGRHPLAHLRPRLDEDGIRRATDLRGIPHGKRVRVAGVVIVRQRPSTAKGIVFLSLEDESGVSNIIVWPDLFEQHRLLFTAHPLLVIEGLVQQQDNVIHVKAERLWPLDGPRYTPESHDFH